MRRFVPVMLALLAFTGIACPPAPVDPPKGKEIKKPDDPLPPPPSLDVLKVKIDGALEAVRSRELLTTNKFWTIFHGILGSGLERTTLTDPKTRKKHNAIEYICAGNPIHGLEFIPREHGLDVLTVSGFGNPLEGAAQGHQDQFIAEMAQWGMERTKKFRVAGKDYTFDDFVRESKMRATTTQKQELSWAIIIIGQYYGTDHEWTNAAGEKLTYDDVVRYEVNAPINEAACGGTHRLFGLTWAYNLHLKKKGKKTQVWQDVEAKIAEHKKLAKDYQSPDRMLSTGYFKGADRNPSSDARIGSTGHIVEWLALAMTDEELKSMWMQEVVNVLAAEILSMRENPIDSGALYHATHGLQLYHDRVFAKPADYLPLPPRQ